jgi:hypothetical protein
MPTILMTRSQPRQRILAEYILLTVITVFVKATDHTPIIIFFDYIH